MPADVTLQAGRPAQVRRRRRLGPGWLPNQHGAWAMLLVPFTVGAWRAGFNSLHVLLLVCCLSGYCAFFAAGLWLRCRPGSARRAALRQPLSGYLLVSAAVGGLLVVIRPDLLVWAVVYLPLALASLSFSARRQDRALANDALTILAACLLGMVAFQVGAGALPWSGHRGWVGMAWVTWALFCYFFGTSWYVKTVIRERHRVSYHRASTAYHLLVTVFWAAAWWFAPVAAPARGWLVVFFAVMTIRAAAMAGRRVRPRWVGLGEIAASAVLLFIAVEL